MDHYSALDPLNIGFGKDVSIRQLAEAVQAIVGFPGKIRFNTDKPDGMPAKLLDSSALAAMGWKPETDFRSAVEKTYDWYRATYQEACS